MSTETSPARLEGRLVQCILNSARQLSGPAQTAAVRHIADFAGVMVAGLDAEPVRKAAACLLAPASSGASGARMPGEARRMEAWQAVLLTAMAGHVHDFDDDEVLLSIAHTSVPVMAATWVLADGAGASGATVARAYACGVETMMRLGQIINPVHYRKGWHSSATLGVFGAAAASAVVMGLDEQALHSALGFAAAMSSGLRASFGSDGKSLQLALAARNGMQAAQLAQGGLRCAPGMLFGPRGYADLYGEGVASADAALGAFGSPSGLVEPGLTIKAYPCCTATHTAIDAVLDLMREHALSWRDIARLTVEVGVDIPPILIYDRPASGLEGKFCMRYCAAAAARYGEVGIAQFEDKAIFESGVQDMMDRVDVVVDQATPRPDCGLADHARVSIAMSDGRVFERRYADPSGSPGKPFSLAQLREKFLRCAAPRLGQARAGAALDLLLSLPALDSFRIVGDAFQGEA